MNCVILQPSYIPWRGYFHQIQRADQFVFLDDVQYDRHGWRNRNRIITPGGVQWLTIPVHSRGHLEKKTQLRDIAICWDRPWNTRHWKTIRQAYGKAPYFDRYRDDLEAVYGTTPRLLADFTIETSIALSKMLGIHDTTFLRSSELETEGTKTEKVLSILKKIGARRYLSGPLARRYLEEDRLLAEGIEVEYMVYDYPEYGQLSSPFEPSVSILDLLFMEGPRAPRYIWET
jgi:hypothetical protein